MNSIMCVSMLAIVAGLALLCQCQDAQSLVCKSDSADGVERGIELADKHDDSHLREALAELNKRENGEMKAKYDELLAANVEQELGASLFNPCPSITQWMHPPQNCWYLIPVPYTVCTTQACQNTCTNMACPYWYRCRQDHYVSKWTIKYCPWSWPVFSIIGWCVPTQCNCYRTNCNGVVGPFNNVCC